MPTLNPDIKKDLGALRILLAEGDQINLAVIKHLLKKEGCYFDLASNGDDILQKIERNTYDVILLALDHNEIDGYNTILTIRSKNHQPPILGIANNLNPVEVKKYANVGVNTYISRPARLTELFGGISKSLVPREAQPEIEINSPVINLKMLYATCGTSQIVNNILRLFIEQSPGNMSQLDEFIKTKNWNGLRNLSHNMKSVYSLIGLSEIKKRFDEIEKDCTTMAIDENKFTAYLITINEVTVKVVDEMKKILEENSNAVIR